MNTEIETEIGDEAFADSMEERARQIGIDLQQLALDMKAKPEEVRPSVIADVITELVPFIDACEHELLSEEMCDDAFSCFIGLNSRMFGLILLQIIGPSTDNQLNKRFWLEVAEVLGPDHAQTLYRAAVFTTKVA